MWYNMCVHGLVSIAEYSLIAKISQTASDGEGTCCDSKHNGHNVVWYVCCQKKSERRDGGNYEEIIQQNQIYFSSSEYFHSKPVPTKT